MSARLPRNNTPHGSIHAVRTDSPLSSMLSVLSCLFPSSGLLPQLPRRKRSTSSAPPESSLATEIYNDKGPSSLSSPRQSTSVQKAVPPARISTLVSRAPGFAFTFLLPLNDTTIDTDQLGEAWSAFHVLRLQLRHARFETALLHHTRCTTV